ncbi:MAG: type II toxin-antitoxin system YafQ family toxin [Oscillospiraceae bacterium]|nr:type II toxin-antitoxin system YafQ family toxin [Oscillospiraceae bacterium]
MNITGYKYKIVFSAKYKRNLKKIQKRRCNLELLYKVVRDLASDFPLDPKHRDHQLTGDMKQFRECHITPDWLLVYEKTKDALILYLYSTGSHADVFE